ncbi:GNAT family N-acetyltransferase [Candidatus Latescibacterota bacterium]
MAIKPDWDTVKSAPEYILPLEKHLIDEASDVLAQAYIDTPPIEYIFADIITPELVKWFVCRGIRYSMRAGEVFTTPDVDGVAVWFKPGHSTLNPLGMLRAGMFAVPYRLGRKAFARLSRYMELTTCKHKALLHEPHWYLCELAVRPDLQGHGIGGALLQPVLDRADSDGLSCYCETFTEKAASFYGKHGFVTAEKVDSGDERPSFWAMVREPDSEARIPLPGASI